MKRTSYQNSKNQHEVHGMRFTPAKVRDNLSDPFNSGCFRMKINLLLLLAVMFLTHNPLRADEPQWVADASKYEFSMTFTSAIYSNGSFVSGEGIVLAAMVDNEVRGVTRSVYDQYNDRWLFFLTAFSNQAVGEKLSFVFYDPVLDDVSNLWNVADFASAANLGSISEPYVFLTEEFAGKSSLVFRVEDENGQPVSDAVVVFNGQELVQGTYQLDDIVPGSYTWSVSCQGYITATGQVVIGVGDVFKEVSVILQPFTGDPDSNTYEVFFSVTDSYGSPLNDVEVLLNNNLYAGNQVVKGVKPGVYNFRVSKYGYISREGQITIASSNMYIDVVLWEQSTNTETSDVLVLGVYPNPAADFVMINIAEPSLISAIKVYAISGKQVLQIKGEILDNKIDISPLNSGVYMFIILLQNGDRIIEKLIVN